MHLFKYRNLGTQAAPINSFTGSFAVNVSGVNPTSAATYQTGVRWFEMRRTGDSFSVFDQGTHNLTPGNGASGLNNWMSSIAQDNNGNIALGFSQSGTTSQANIKIAGRTGGQVALGTLNEGEATFFAASGSQTSTSNRWGDYSSMNVDPVDDCTFWYTQEYYSATSSAGWSTRVGSFKYPSCTNAPKGTISGTITLCATGVPVNLASVDATGGINRITGAPGTYSMTVAPGTYTVNASKGTGLTGTPQSGLVVVDGSNVTANICLAGVPVLTGGTATIVSESCLPANGVADPGETVTFALPVSNTGGANTVADIGTLQATGGVISPAGTGNYGVVTAGGAAVSRNFTFTVSPSVTCGTNITATVQHQDGASNLGNVTYTIPTGAVTSVLTENFDSVTAPTLPAGWVATNVSGAAPLWVTATGANDTAPNVAFIDDPAAVSNKVLDTPSFVAAAGSQVTFRHSFTLEDTFDGGVLEISINGGAFSDIVSAGGSFVTGGYTGLISASFGSPIAGRSAWTGTQSSFLTTTANLPAAAIGQPVKLRLRMASDSSVSGTGWRVDTVKMTFS